MSLFAQILATLAGAPEQHARMLVLHTPLGADVLVAERAEIEECIGPMAGGPVAGFRIVVHALASDAHLELKQLLGQPALLELLTAASRNELRPFHGHVTEAALVGSDGGLARYRLVIEPWVSFLAHRVDAYAFQGQSVVQIIEEVFADYAGQGRLAPAWRWELADKSVYPARSLCIQYQESDLGFVLRLMREEGLVFWFEHGGAADDATLGAHTLVIADHNAAFKPNAQDSIRFTQANVALGEDTITAWHEEAALHAASVSLASHDYRSLSMRPQSRSADPASGATLVPALELVDVPGLYAYEDAAQGDRLALRQMQAIDAMRSRATAGGTVRSAAPATTFVFTDHASHDGSSEPRDRFVMLAVSHSARNNLRADEAADVRSLLGTIEAIGALGAAGPTSHHVLGAAALQRQDAASLPNQGGAEPAYRSTIRCQRAEVPVRFCALDENGLPDPRLHPRPSVHGVQTAVVVGTSGEPVHTDRDHRVRVQFHWQRGGRASHGLSHPAGTDNAPANEQSGTWVRVAAAVAGANWGSVFAPRMGQEVLVQFVAGDIDRAVVTGVLYNGSGSADAQGNQVAGGAAGASGNAAAWFPGAAKSGRFEGHQHTAVLAGYKSQELASSQAGAGGYNQLSFDDSPTGSRVELSTTAAQTRLQLGHLLNQNDNQRLQPRGHGVDLSTAGWGALRAGSGLLISAHGKPGSGAGGSSLDSREPQTQVEQSQELLHTLAESAQKQRAIGAGEPDVVGAKAAETARQLANEQALYAAMKSLGSSDQRTESGASGTRGEGSIGGGTGRVTAWSRPDLVIAAPAGIAAFTPATLFTSAGNTLTSVAGQDTQLAVQANQAWSIKSGLVFYTYGKAANASKPNTETGIRLHAATGNVNTQSQSGATRLTADKKIEVASTGGMVRVAAPAHILLTAAGAAIDIQPGSITLKGPGKIEFKAAMKELTGPGSASLPDVRFPRVALDIRRTALFPLSL